MEEREEIGIGSKGGKEGRNEGGMEGQGEGGGKEETGRKYGRIGYRRKRYGGGGGGGGDGRKGGDGRVL